MHNIIAYNIKQIDIVEEIQSNFHFVGFFEICAEVGGVNAY